MHTIELRVRSLCHLVRFLRERRVQITVDVQPRPAEIIIG